MQSGAAYTNQKLTRHAEVLCFISFESTLGTRDGLSSLVLETLSTNVIFAVARLAPEARILAVSVAERERKKDRKVNSYSSVYHSTYQL